MRSLHHFLWPVCYVKAINFLVTDCLLIQVDYKVRNILTHHLISDTCIMIITSSYAVGFTYSFQGRPETRGRPGKVNNVAPLKPNFLKLFRPRTGLANLLRARAQIADNFRRKSFSCRSLSLLALYLRLFQWRRSTRYRPAR